MPRRKPDYTVYDREADKWWGLWINGGSCNIKITRNERGRWIELDSALLYRNVPRTDTVAENVPVTLLNYIKP